MIFHADCNNFFASCECLEHPELKNVPMAVAGDPEARTGIVVAKNELAKKYGVKTTDTVYTAKRKCPDIVFVPPRHRFYKQISDQVNSIYLEYTDFVEPASIDESYISYECDLPVQFADTLRARIRNEIGITISVGVSYCKIFAKMGSDYKKPDATTLITRENFRELLWPLPVSDLLFAGRAASEALRRKYIMTIGDLARFPRENLSNMLGRQGELLWDYANGIDPSRVRRFGERTDAKSVSHGMTFPHDLAADEEIRAYVNLLSDAVSSELRKKGMVGTFIEIRIRRPDFSILSRQNKLSVSTNFQADIRKAAYQLITANIPPGSPIRSLTIGMSGLKKDDAPEQLSIFSSERERQEKVQTIMEDIRRRYGRDTIRMGVYPPRKGGSEK